MPTIDEAYKEAYALAKPYGVMAMDLRILLMHDEGLREQIDVLFYKEREMKNYELFKEQVQKLIKGEPVEYILGEADFLGNPIKINENVLIPRSETEELVSGISERIDNYYDPRNYLVCADIGTGSGCISIGLRQSFSNWLLVASDISPKALEVAKENFERYNIRAQVLEGDALAPYIENNINLDIIVSNPPYILNKEDAQASVRDYEPASALWLDKEHSVYESIFRDYKKVKKGSLFMAFEISPDLEMWLDDLMKKYLDDYSYEFAKDLNGFTRFLYIFIK